MSFAFFMPLLTYPDATPDTGLLRAIDFAATLGGRVTAVGQIVDIPSFTNPLAGLIVDTAAISAATEKASRDACDRLSRQTASLARRMALASETDSVVARPGFLADMLAARARTSDATLMPFDCESDTHRDVAEALLFGSGGPVVFFPAVEAPTHLETVVIAWDASRSAARAVRDALPILLRAKRTIVLTARSDKAIDDADVDALQRFLAGHGVETAHHDQEPGAEPVGSVLQSFAAKADAGLLVMGAYGHSRLREFILGGATRTTLHSMRLPILMSH